MNVVTNFEKRKREKRLHYERSLLSELSISELKRSVLLHFGAGGFFISPWLNESLEEACIDVAIEAFLVGGEMSRFSVYGESVDFIRHRCRSELNHCIDTLYHFWLYWDFEYDMLREESIFVACNKFVDLWWQEGFEKGYRRHKLRLY